MTPEEYQKFKEAEKEHLRKIRDLKKAQRSASRKSTVTKAVTGMATDMQDLFDEHGQMIERLQMDSAMSEARMEVALDSVEMDSRVSEAQDAAELAKLEEEQKKARARDLINQMKQETGAVQKQNADASEPNPIDAKAEEKPLPEKTIGRMKP